MGMLTLGDVEDTFSLFFFLLRCRSVMISATYWYFFCLLFSFGFILFLCMHTPSCYISSFSPFIPLVCFL